VWFSGRPHVKKSCSRGANHAQRIVRVTGRKGEFKKKKSTLELLTIKDLILFNALGSIKSSSPIIHTNFPLAMDMHLIALRENPRFSVFLLNTIFNLFLN
jgi:hypothetical protein